MRSLGTSFHCPLGNGGIRRAIARGELLDTGIQRELAQIAIGSQPDFRLVEALDARTLDAVAETIAAALPHQVALSIDGHEVFRLDALHRDMCGPRLRTENRRRLGRITRRGRLREGGSAKKQEKKAGGNHEERLPQGGLTAAPGTSRCARTIGVEPSPC